MRRSKKKNRSASRRHEPIRGLALLFLLGALVLAPRAAAAEGGVLDPSFGEAGISLTRPGGNSTGDAALALTEDGRGRLVAVGTTDNYGVLVRRFLADGSIDPSFDGNGRVETSLGGNAAGWAVRMLSGGGILVAGSTDQGLALIRYRSDGSREKSFGRNGHVVTSGGVYGAGASALDVRRDGRIVIGGYRVDHLHRHDGLVIGYKPNGSIEQRFADDGTFRLKVPKGYTVAVTGVEVLPDGKILIGGDWAGYLFLARLLPNGELDPSFGVRKGYTLVDVDGSRHCPCSFANALAIDPGGRPLLAGYADGPKFSSLLARFTPDGRLDRRFGDHGTVRTVRGSGLILNGLTLQRDGHITAVGYFGMLSTGQRQLAILRYLPDGHLDSSFAHHGFFTRHFGRESIASAAITQPDGRVVVAGRAVLGKTDPELPEPLEGSQVLMMRLKP